MPTTSARSSSVANALTGRSVPPGVDQLPSGIILKDLEGGALFANDRASELFGNVGDLSGGCLLEMSGLVDDHPCLGQVDIAPM